MNTDRRGAGMLLGVPWQRSLRRGQRDGDEDASCRVH